MRSIKPTVILLSALALATAAGAQVLNVGDPAPPVKVAKWVKGSPAEPFEKGKVYVVEFWATWCKPCATTIPYLTKLAKKYADQVTFIGVSVWERGEGIPKKVTDFVEKMGDEMAYNVGMDEATGTMTKTWLDPAGTTAIPTAFVVNGDGVVAWFGHPMVGMDEALGKILDGSFDLQKTKTELLPIAERGRQRVALRKAVEAATEDYAAGKREQAIRALEKIAAENPKSAWSIDTTIVKLMSQDDVSGAEKRVETLSKGMKAEDALRLATLGAQVALHTKNADNKPARDFGLKVVLQANKLAKEQNLEVLNMLAGVYWNRKEASKAVECQKKVIELLPKSDYKDNAKVRKQVEDQLKLYQAGLK